MFISLLDRIKERGHFLLAGFCLLGAGGYFWARNGFDSRSPFLIATLVPFAFMTTLLVRRSRIRVVADAQLSATATQEISTPVIQVPPPPTPPTVMTMPAQPAIVPRNGMAFGWKALLVVFVGGIVGVLAAVIRMAFS